MKNAILKVSNVNKWFHDPQEFHVLQNINMEAYRGEFLSLVGKSGCGKSTLMYLLSTLDTDYKGEITINDVLVTGKNQNFLSRFRNAHIGFVFQFHYLLPEFSSLENVMIPARRLGKYPFEELEERAYEKLKWLGMADQAKKPANKLSGGQQQRVAIARALINDPDIIMGDEPTGNLDSVNSGIVFDIFKQLTREFNQTIIAVTHDDEFASNTDRVIELQDGHIIGEHINA
ncbi:MAG: ABC transporter ATP-binding protein [Cyclobacteriaceae bacterium]|nr:ABC transporter ATP-binding protein [Cyclobacteriaceae bacterium]